MQIWVFELQLPELTQALHGPKKSHTDQHISERPLEKGSMPMLQMRQQYKTAAMLYMDFRYLAGPQVDEMQNI